MTGYREIDRGARMSIMEQAESLYKKDLSHEEWYDLSRDLWPDLLAECKRQQADIDQLTTALADSGKTIQITPVSEAISEARSEAAQWQAVAIESMAKLRYDEDASRDAGFSVDDWGKCNTEETRCLYRERAAQELGCSPRAWLMTPERIAAIDLLLDMIDDDPSDWNTGSNGPICMDILRSMLAEAKQ